jgi:hypothetical protein
LVFHGGVLKTFNIVESVMVKPLDERFHDGFYVTEVDDEPICTNWAVYHYRQVIRVAVHPSALMAFGNHRQ